MTNEKLIEEARARFRIGDGDGWCLVDQLADALEAAVTPTDEKWRRTSPGFDTTREAYEWLTPTAHEVTTDEREALILDLKVVAGIMKFLGYKGHADTVLRAIEALHRTARGEPSEALLSEIEQRVYDENKGQIAGMAKALVRAGWDAAAGFRRTEVPEPSAEEWAARIDTAREKAIAKGYTPEHDARHGVRHLLRWAIDYARRGKAEDSSGLIAAAMDLADVAYSELERLRHVADTMSAVSEALRTRYAGDSQAAYFMRQIDGALEALPEPQGEPSDALCGDWPAPCNCDDPETHDGSVPASLVTSERVLAEPSTEVPEPSAEAFCNCGSLMVRADQSDTFTLTCPKGRCGSFRLAYKRSPEPQGEPSDAQVLAALNSYEAWGAEESLDMWGSDQVDRMRAALRVAWGVR